MRKYRRSPIAVAPSLVIAATFALAVLTSRTATTAERPNVLLLCIDDLRPELPCYGKQYIDSPNIDRLAARSRVFRRHFVQAPTCGASRYALLTGQYGPGDNNALMSRAKVFQSDPDQVATSMPTWFRSHGYSTVSVGKVSHYPGGRGGPDWNDDSKPELPGAWNRHLLRCGKWQHPRGVMHGLANGEIRVVAGKMDLFQSVDGPDTIYPDGQITEQSLEQLDQLVGDTDKPFFLAVGFIRPHLPFGAPDKYLQPYRDIELPPIPHPKKPVGKTTWHPSGEFMKYNRWGRNPITDPDFATEVRRHYAACVSYADAQVGRLLDRVNQLGIADKTIVVLWGDHGWHLGEHAIWGKHSLFEESLHAPLLIHFSGIPDAGQPTDAMVETLDIFPTLCELAGLPHPSFAHGESLVPKLTDTAAKGHDAISYTRNATTIRTDSHRLIAHKSGDFELYDHRSPKKETFNLADQNPELVQDLHDRLKSRLKLRDHPLSPN